MKNIDFNPNSSHYHKMGTVEQDREQRGNRYCKDALDYKFSDKEIL